MVPDMEEVDVGEPDEAKKDPFNSDKASMLPWPFVLSDVVAQASFHFDKLSVFTCTEAKLSDSV